MEVLQHLELCRLQVLLVQQADHTQCCCGSRAEAAGGGFLRGGGVVLLGERGALVARPVPLSICIHMARSTVNCVAAGWVYTCVVCWAS